MPSLWVPSFLETILALGVLAKGGGHCGIGTWHPVRLTPLLMGLPSMGPEPRVHLHSLQVQRVSWNFRGALLPHCQHVLP